MKNLLSFNYWFNLRPEALNPMANKAFIALILLLVIGGGIFLWLKNRKGFYRFLFKKLYNFSISNAIIGLLFLFFNYENAIFFSARFWLLAWLIMMIIWLIFIAKELRKIPLQKRQAQENKDYKKYIP
ncbi:MAG: hypothetical protein WC441_04095 [Patescibacteria group bacterium]